MVYRYGFIEMSVKVISFDLDGTLVDYSFIDSIWFNEIPNLYSLKNQVPFEKAKKIIVREYDRIGEDKLEWYDLKYWLDKFNLGYKPGSILIKNRDKVKVYPEVKESLEKFQERFTLALNSNSPREFMKIELMETKLKKFFHYIFSSTSDFRQVKKTPQYYAKVCDIMRIDPKSIVHVGDNWRFDYLVPSQIGIRAVYLDRKMISNSKQVIHSLSELERVVEEFNSH